MKKIYFLIFSISLYISQEISACGPPFGQDASPPVCPEREYDSNTAFDWTATSFTYYKDVNGTAVATNLTSPFHQNIGNTSNVYPFSLPQEKDYSYEDGWRFIKNQFGDPSEGVSNPWFMLYNVHSGILRLFFAIDEAEQNDYARITLSFYGNRKTALLEHYNTREAISNLDDFQGDGVASNPNEFSNTTAPAFWLHADFAMYYDPCTCTLDSDLQMSVDLVDEATLELSFTGELSQIDLQANPAGIMHGGNVSSSFSDYVSGFKSVQSGATTLSKIFTAASPPRPATPAVYDAHGNVIILAKPASPGIPAGSIETFADVASLFSGGGALIQGAAKVFKLLFGSSSAPTATVVPPPKPLKFDIEMNAKGDIVNGSNYSQIQMQTPGGDHTGNVSEFIPHYDNIMGIMSILKANARWEAGYLNYDGYYNSVLAVRFGLDEQIEFALNPRAQIDLLHQNLTENYIKAAWEFTTEDGTVVSSDYYDLNCFLNYQPYFDYVSVFNTIGVPPSSEWPDNWFTDEIFFSVRIKIMALFTTTNGIKIPYILSVEPNWVDYSGGAIGTDPADYGTVFPENDCNNWENPVTIVTPNYPEPVKNVRIAELCNSAGYLASSGQSLLELDDTSYKVESTENKGERALEYDQLEVYPNPASDYFTLRYGIESEGPIKIALFDTNGKVIKVILDEVKHGKGIYEIGVNVSDLIPGSYYIKNEKTTGVDSKVIMLN